MTSSLDEIHDTLNNLVEAAEVSLKPMSPKQGVERYLKHRQEEISENTLKEYRRKLDFFLEYCEAEGIHDLNQMDGRKIDGYETWRRYESSDCVDVLGQKTMRDDMYLMKSFFTYQEKIDSVTPGLQHKVKIPTLSDGDGVRNDELSAERNQRILAHLAKYEYATVDHIVWALHWYTGRRPGGIHSLDLKDVHTDTSDPYLEFRHRGGTTSLKKGERGEGSVNLPEVAAELFEDYKQNRRYDVLDKDGRQPFLTSKQGRLSKPYMRKLFYKWTRPCKVGKDCPHNQDMQTCAAAQTLDKASTCESAKSPITDRHGHITELLRLGVPIAIISERCDVSEEVIEKHYDERSEEECRQHRRDILSEYTQNSEVSF